MARTTDSLLHEHVELDLNSVSLLEQPFACKNVVPLEYIILIPN